MKLTSERREFLRSTGLGVGALALGPVLHRLEARGAGVEKPAAPRFVFVVESNGLPPQQLAPSGITTWRFVMKNPDAVIMKPDPSNMPDGEKTVTRPIAP